MHLCKSILPSHIGYKVTVSTLNVTTRERFIILGIVIMVWWDFSRGGAYSAFRWETRKKNFANLRGSGDNEELILTLDMSVRSSRRERGRIHFVTCSLSSAFSPYPHFHKHIQDTDALSRHGTVTHKSCSSTIDFYK